MRSFFVYSVISTLFIFLSNALTAANAALQFDISIILDDPECYGEGGFVEIVEVVGGTPPYEFAIDNGAFQEETFFDNVLAGEHVLIGRDASGCMVELVVSLNEPDSLEVQIFTDLEPNLPVLDIGEELNVFPAVSTTADLDYAWFVNGEFYSNDQSLNLTVWDTLFLEVEIFDWYACSAYDSLTIYPRYLQPYFVPNIFSPNNDGINDLLTIYGRSHLVQKIQRIQIFTRKGDQVYEQRNFPINDNYGWDGYHKGKKVNPNVFVYILEVVLWDGTVDISRGTFVVAR